jgi:YtkA-like
MTPSRAVLPLAVFALASSACAPAAPDDHGAQKVAAAQSGALTVTLLAAHPLKVGLNEVFYEISRDGTPVTEAAVVQKPLMTMMAMKHACPLVNPEGQANHHGQFEGRLVFTMPSSQMETWALTVEVTLPGEATATAVTFDTLEVADSAARKSLDLNGVGHVVTLSFEGDAKVGSNAYFVTVHRPETAMKMNYLPVTDLTLIGRPEMPSMGHGSSGNVNPTHLGGGVYEGSVNFSMAGDWVLSLELLGPGDAQLGQLEWDIAL